MAVQLPDGRAEHPLFSGTVSARPAGRRLSWPPPDWCCAALALAWPYGLEARKAGIQKEIEAAGAHLAPGVRLPYGQELRVVRQALQDRAEQLRPFPGGVEPSLASLLVEAMQTARLESMTSTRSASRRTPWRCEAPRRTGIVASNLAEPFRRRGLHVALERQDAGLDEKVHFTLKGDLAP